MPYAAPRVCAEPGCTEATPNARCARHEKSDTRPSAAARGYGSAWQARRRRILARDPWCRACGTERTSHVDHVIPRAHGGSDDDSNLQGLCTSCHSRKTATQDGGFGNPKRGAA